MPRRKIRDRFPFQNTEAKGYKKAMHELYGKHAEEIMRMQRARAEEETKPTRMRRAYLGKANITQKPVHTGLSKEGMANLYNHMPKPDHSQAFGDGVVKEEHASLHAIFADMHEKQFNRIKNLMETRAKMLEDKHRRLTTKDKTMWVVIQQSKHFKLVLFWNSSQYSFIKYEDLKGLVSVSRPYLNRVDAMSAHENREIYWLDFIEIPV